MPLQPSLLESLARDRVAELRRVADAHELTRGERRLRHANPIDRYRADIWGRLLG